ncbi:Npt1/Npt2 family nucleotide transporter [Lignipirellula cremea]|uniref:ADP,ATP carrier protein n=1 Tax=Lignipirellula cremea TaxID=2528010 RepID=A0A518E272_9BACT|nr:Npt1/Npt2 family nucleotide transporter [Lignipirellula cremea]QDU98195.1 TLC ATP/ADP transporter [Lignipirellula cremea]
MQLWIERLFEIPSSEQRKTLLTLLYIFFSVSTCVVGRTTADSLFLARIGAEYLATIYLVSSIGVAATAIFYVRAVSRLPLRRLIVTTHLVLAIAVIVMRLTPTRPGHDFVFVSSMYLLSEIQGAMTAILFATLLNELFHGKHAGGIFGLSGLGSTLAGIVFGTLLAMYADQIHVINLLMMMAALHVAAMIPILLLHKEEVTVSATVKETGPSPEVSGEDAADADVSPADVADANGSLGSSPMVRAVVLLAAVKFTAIVLVGFQWKVAVIDDLYAAEDRIAAYFGAYYAWSNLATAVLQLLVAGRVLKRFGVLPALLAFPFGLLVAAGSILWSSQHGVLLWAATFSKGTEVLRRSFSDPAMQMLYGPLPTGVRRKTIALTGGAVKPLVQAAASLALLRWAALADVHQLSLVVIGLVLIWILLAFQCGRLFNAT